MRTFTFADIAAYKAAKASGGAIYAALVGDANLKSGAVVSKITATGDVLIDALNPFVTPNLATNEDTLYYSSTEGYRSLRKGSTTWDANSLNQIYIDTSRLPSGFAVVEAFNDVFTFKSMQGETTGSGRSKMVSVRGNSVAWNQLVPMFDSSYTCANGTISVSNGIVTLNSSGGRVTVWDDGDRVFPVSQSHKYYCSCDIKSSRTATYNILFSYYYNDFGYSTAFNLNSNYSRVSCVKSAKTNVNNGRSAIAIIDSASGDVFNIKDYIIIDLTLLYGSAISGLTDEQIKAKFEAEFPNAYYDYDEGKLLSNAASAMEVTGFNLWDEEYRLGDYQNGVFNPNVNTPVLCNKNPIPVIPSATYYIKTDASNSWVYFYDEKMTYIYGGAKHNTTFTIPENVRFINFNLSSSTGLVCINLSDLSKNGTYEPYKKTIVPIDVTKIRVKSPNIWDEEWETGAYYQSSGEKNDSASGNFRSKNRISCCGSTKYYAKIPADGIKILFYSGSGAYLGVANVVSLNQSGEFTTPASAEYFAFYCNFSGSYSNNICINKSDPGFNGKYYPHGSIVPFPEGMGSAGSVYDEIAGKKLSRRFYKVNLGDLTWSVGSSCFVSQALSTAGLPAAKEGSVGSDNNVACARYATRPTRAYADYYSDKQCGLSVNGTQIIVKDSSYSSASDFKTAMQNGKVEFIYELANPEVFELDYPITPIIYPAKGGTKRILPVNGSSPVTAPFSCMVQPI